MDIKNIDMINRLNGINQSIEKIGEKASEQVNRIDNEEKVSFKDMLQGYMNDVNSLQKQADNSVNRLAAGEITDIHEVMVKVEEANLSFSMMMELRNKIVEGYKEIMRTTV